MTVGPTATEAPRQQARHDEAFHALRLDNDQSMPGGGDERVSLTPKAFDLLQYLVDHCDRLVTQDEILEALGPTASSIMKLSRSTSWESGTCSESVRRNEAGAEHCD